MFGKQLKAILENVINVSYDLMDCGVERIDIIILQYCDGEKS